MDENTLTGHLLELSRSLDEYRVAVKKAHDLFAFEVEALWKDQADLRDEVTTNVTALGNRLENLTAFVTSNPSEVAAKIVDDANRGTLREVFQCRTSVGCNLSEPHIHAEDGGVIRVPDAATADVALAQRRERDRIIEDNQ
jgi:hypothetical protein